jgi:hypothetical protein
MFVILAPVAVVSDGPCVIAEAAVEMPLHDVPLDDVLMADETDLLTAGALCLVGHGRKA